MAFARRSEVLESGKGGASEASPPEQNAHHAFLCPLRASYRSGCKKYSQLFTMAPRKQTNKPAHRHAGSTVQQTNRHFQTVTTSTADLCFVTQGYEYAELASAMCSCLRTAVSALAVPLYQKSQVQLKWHGLLQCSPYCRAAGIRQNNVFWCLADAEATSSSASWTVPTD